MRRGEAGNEFEGEEVGRWGGGGGQKKTQSSAVTSDHRDRSISKMIDRVRPLSARLEHNGCLLYGQKKKKKKKDATSLTEELSEPVVILNLTPRLCYLQGGWAVDNQHMHHETPTRLNCSAVSC